jgi:type I restriction enzyme S subunit
MEVDDWHEIELGSIGTVITGRTPSTARSEYFGGDIPFITPTDMDGRRFISTTNRYLSEAGKNAVAKAVIPAGAIVVSCIGSDMGKSAIAGRTSVTNQQINSLIVSAPHSALFVYYNLSSRRDEIRGMAAGSAQPILNKASFSRIRLRLPPPSEQQAIAAVLGALDDKIEQNRRTARALEALARATFKAWFVDFEPVKAKAAGATNFPGMPHAAFAALPSGLTDSPLGPVPQGWAVGKLGNHCGINERSVRAGQIDGGIEYIDIASVTVGRLDGVQRVPFAEAPSRARRQVRHGDTIWSCVRPNRRSYLFIHSPPENWIVSTGFAVLSPASFGPSYLHELTTRQEFVDYLVSNADGSAYPAVRPEHFAAADVLVPPAELRDVFEEMTVPLRNLLAAGEAESSTLATLRDYLLPRLLNGGVRVRPSQTETQG